MMVMVAVLCNLPSNKSRCCRCCDCTHRWRCTTCIARLGVLGLRVDWLSICRLGIYRLRVCRLSVPCLGTHRLCVLRLRILRPRGCRGRWLRSRFGEHRRIGGERPVHRLDHDQQIARPQVPVIDCAETHTSLRGYTWVVWLDSHCGCRRHEAPWGNSRIWRIQIHGDWNIVLPAFVSDWDCPVQIQQLESSSLVVDRADPRHQSREALLQPANVPCDHRVILVMRQLLQAFTNRVRSISKIRWQSCRSCRSCACLGCRRNGLRRRQVRVSLWGSWLSCDGHRGWRGHSRGRGARCLDSGSPRQIFDVVLEVDISCSCSAILQNKLFELHCRFVGGNTSIGLDSSTYKSLQLRKGLQALDRLETELVEVHIHPRHASRPTPRGRD
mmetsp:Transcript_95792/g.256009  ORF Transcript_95792/g.256009 Transcript_95792/m.256009 type:complete len:385 (+) Transcript_95792:443-1597(+)